MIEKTGVLKIALIKNLAVGLSLNSSSFSKGLKGARSSLKSFTGSLTSAKGLLAGFGVALSAGAIIAGLKSLHKEASNNIDQMSKFADEVGISTETLAGYRLGAELTGTSMQSLEKGLQRFVRVVGEAKMGIGAGAKGFDQLGLSAESLANMDTAEGFKLVAERISNLSTPAEKAAAAYKIFGRQGQELLTFFEAGGDGIDGFVKEADRLGLSFSRVDGAQVEAANDAMTKMGTIFTSLGQQLAIQLAPFVEALANKLTDMGTQGWDMGQIVQTALMWIVKGVALVADVVHTLGLGFKYLQAGVTKAISLLLFPLSQFYKGITEILNLLGLEVDTTFFETLREELDRVASEQLKEANEALLIEPPSTAILGFVDDLTEGARKSAEALHSQKDAVEGVSNAMFEAEENAQKLIDKLQDQLLVTKMGSEEAELYKLSQQGVSEAVLNEARALQAQIDKLEEDKKAKEDIEKAIESTIQNTRTPIEEFEAEIANLNEQLAAGLPAEAFDRAVKQAQEKLKDALPEETSSEVQLAGAALAGSAAARSSILRNSLGQNDPMKKIQEVSEEELAETKKQTTLMKKLVDAQTDSFITVKI